MQTTPTYHFVSHAHWDREWYLTFEEFRARLVDMIDELFDVMEKNSSFGSFLFDGQMALVLDYLEIKPEKKEQFIDFVRRGKFIIGPWYTLADQSLPSGESHIRNLLLGLRCARELGDAMMIGYIPDQFGQIAQMPQILSGFGINAAIVYRGFGGETGQASSEYFWSAPDGSRVLLHHLHKDGYSFGYFACDSDDEIRSRFEKLKNDIDARARTSHRLILNGGDHFHVDGRITDAICILQSRVDSHVVHSSLEKFFDGVTSELDENRLPTVNGELRFGLKHAFALINGTASSRISVKQKNYQCQTLLEKVVEPLHAIAVIRGRKSSASLIRHAWKILLQNQDHDVLCGTCIDRVYDEVMVRFEKVNSIAHEVTRLLLHEIIPHDQSGCKDDKHLVVFNFLPHERADVVECEIEFFLHDVIIGINPDAQPDEPSPPCSGFRMIDTRGEEIPFQILHREERYGIVYSKHSYPHQIKVDRFRILLEEKSLPSMGYKSYAIERTEALSHYVSGINVGEYFLENNFIKVTMDDDGSLSLFDKETNALYEHLNYVEDGGDVGDEYTFCPPDRDAIVYSHHTNVVREIVESGPLRAAIRVHLVLHVPAHSDPITQRRSDETVSLEIQSTISLTRFSRLVDIKTLVMNNARDHRLRVLFDTGITTNISFTDSQFAIVKRVHTTYDWDEFPIEKPLNLQVMQKFATIQDEERACTLLTKGLPEYELMPDSSGRLALTLLRSVGQLSRSDLKTRPGGDAGWKNDTPGAQCIGEHEFEYSIFVHRPSDHFHDVLTESEQYHTPCIVATLKHDVDIPDEKSFARLESHAVVLTAFKEAEDGNGVMFRFNNPTSHVDTYRFTYSLPHSSIAFAGLDERVIEQIETGTNTIAHSCAPYKIITIKLQVE